MLDEFRIEADEMFEGAEESLLAIDNGAEFEANYNGIFRAFHSLKGAAGMFGLEKLQGHMHKLESLFEKQKSKGRLSKELVDYFLAGVDAARNILQGEEVNFEYITDDEKVVKTTEEVQKISNRVREHVIEAGQSKQDERKDYPLVYIVDDEPEIVTIIASILSDSPYNLKTYYSAEDALKDIFNDQPDVVLSDIKMGGMSGLEFLKIVKKDLPDLPVVFISAYITKQAMMNALGDGAFAFIDKPIQDVSVIQTVRIAIRKHRSTKLLNKSINYILYQFSDLDNYLASQGKDNVRKTLREDLEMILEQRRILKEIG